MHGANMKIVLWLFRRTDKNPTIAYSDRIFLGSTQII